MATSASKLLAVGLTAAFISACADAPTSSAPFSPSLHVAPIATPQREIVVLCKSGPPGTYTFDATATHPVLLNEGDGGYSLQAATYTIVVAPGSMINVGATSVPGACYDFQGHNHIALAGGGTDATVTIVENESANPTDVVFEKVDVYQNNAGAVSMTSSTTNSAAAKIGGPVTATFGASVVFYNVLDEITGCTYTKGWYRNNGSSTVVDVDGRTAAQAQTIFGATPGKPNGVTWEGGNNTLNLYQQLLAALLNRGSNASTGITEVDQAIADAEAATGGSVLNITLVAGTDVSALIETLSAFNEGTYEGWPHCDD